MKRKRPNDASACIIKKGAGMKRIVWLGLSLLALASVSGLRLTAQQSAPEPVLPASAPFKASTTLIPMRDGRQLAADVYVPKEGAKFPAVLVQTPYNKSQLRPAFSGQGRYGADSLFTDT